MLELNKIYLMDCVEGMKKLPDKSVNLIVADPPYNIGIAKWDKINNYVDWCGLWFKQCERLLKDNGSFYWWHNDMVQIAQLMEWLRLNTSFVFNSFIVWDKGDFRARSWKNPMPDNPLRSWFNTAEYCLFYTFQDSTGLEEITESHIKPKNPFAKYLRDEFKEAKITNIEVAKLFPSKTGGLTGCVSNWLNGDNIITEEQYLKIREHLNYKYLRREYKYLRREYEDLRKEYEDLRKEYEDLRYTHNLDPNHNNIWRYQTENLGNLHICQKPLAAICRIINCSSKEGDLVLDPFAGSGTVSVSAHKLGRKHIAFENDKASYAVAKDRLWAEMAQSTIFDLLPSQ